MPKNSQVQRQFHLLIIYYWIISVLSFMWVGMPLEEFRFSFPYFVTVLPVLAFEGINFPWEIFFRGFKKITLSLYVYILLVTLVSLARLDYATAYNVTIFALVIVIIIKKRLTINVKLINILFILTIIFCIWSFHAGINPYGYLPLQGRHICYQYRISLFPKAVVGSAFFSLLVVMINYFFNKGRSRWGFIMVGMYFLILSANRTSMLCFALVFLFMCLTKLFSFRVRSLYRVFFALAISFFIIMPYCTSFIIQYGNSQNEYLNYIMYHNRVGIDSEEDLEGIIARTIIWGEHYRLFLDTPWFGRGTYKLSESYNFTGSESFLTGLLARVGLMIIPLILFFVGLVRRSMVTRNRFLYSLMLCIVLIMLGYGSFMVPYSFMFLLIFGSINMGKYVRKDAVLHRTSSGV